MTFETLERRLFLSVSFTSASGFLTINGSTSGDVVSVAQSGTGLTATDAKVKYTYTAAQVKSIKVSLGAGADSVSIGSTVLAPTTITAGSGNDTLLGGGGTTVILGGAGIDSITAGAGVNTITGGTGGGIFVAGSGSDSITAGNGTVTLMGGSGPATLVGGSGSDTYAFGVASTAAIPPTAQGIYVMSPGTGITTLNFSALPASQNVTVNLTNDLDVASFAGRMLVSSAMGQAARITRVIGNAGADNFTANSANDSLVGGAGTNTLVAGSGKDTLTGGGTSTEYIFSPETTATHYTLNQATGGNNTLNFQALAAGDDLTLNLNYDVMASYDNVTISDGKAGQYVNFNEILDGNGDDLITCNNDGDSLLGGNGYDTIFGGTGADLIFPGSGYDVISGDGGADTVFGGSGNYVIYATNYLSDPSLIAPPAAGTVATKVAKPAVATAGIQVYAFGTGSASIVGSAGDDTLEGSGADTIHGLGGNDYISAGGAGEQSEIFGDGGSDQIFIGSGDTTVSGGGGVDTITAGTAGGANDFIDNNIPDNSSTAGGGSVIDAVALTANAIAADQGLATPTYPLLGTAGVGSLITGKSANMTVIGGLGDDTLQGGDGPATLVGGSGDQQLVAGYGNDVVQGGAGDDTIVAGFGADLLQGGLGDTTFFNVNGFPDTLVAGAGQNVAQVDPTGQTTITGNIQYLYSPGVVAAPPPPPADAPVIPSAVIASPVVASAAKAAAPLAQPAVGPAIPVPAIVGTVLQVGSKTSTTNQGISVSQVGNIITVGETAVGVFTFSASAITSVSVSGGPGADYIVLNTLLVPAICNAGNGDNYVVGGTANETLIGGSGNDELIGGPGHNLIEGGNGTNSLYGGTGNDTIIGGNRYDNIYPGGYGIAVGSDPESDSIVGGTGNELLYMNCNADPLTARLDLGTITDNVTGAVTHVSGVKTYFAGIGNTLIVVPPKLNTFAVNGGGGMDTIFGTSINDVLYGGIGLPTVYALSKGQTVDLTGVPGGQPAYYYLANATDKLDAGYGNNIPIPFMPAP